MMMNEAQREAQIRLLLVEDEAESALAVQRMLVRRGVDVCLVTGLFWVSCGWNPCVFVLTWRSKAGFRPH